MTLEKYNLYLKISNAPVPLKKVTTISVNEETMSVYALLDIANIHLKSVAIMAGISMPDEDGNMGLRTIPMRVGRVDLWQYMEEYNGYVGIADVIGGGFPIELKAFCLLKEVKV